jgi:hypothetical protein
MPFGPTHPASPFTTYDRMSHLHVGPACQPLLSPPFPLSLCVFPVTASWGQGAAPPMAAALPVGFAVSATPLRIVLHRPSLCPGTLGRLPIKRVAPASPCTAPPLEILSPKSAAAHGDSSLSTARRRRRGGEGEAGGEENREAALGEPDHLVATRTIWSPPGLQARPPDGGTPVRGPRSRSCSSRRRPPLHRAKPTSASSAPPHLLRRLAGTPRSGAVAPPTCAAEGRRRRLKPEPLAGDALHRGAGTGLAKNHTAPVCTLFTTASPPPAGARGEHRNPLDLVVDPAFEPRLDRALCARCLFVDRCPAPRRRADPPSLENRSSSRAGRLQVPLPSTPRALLCLASFLGSTCARRVPVCRRHPQAEHATVEPRPCLCLAGSRVSTNPRRAHFLACRHPVYVPLSCACCRHCAIATAVPPKFCPHTPPPGRGPIPPGRTCARALVDG